MVAIGIDSADPDLIERWLATGALPHLRDLRARGAYGRLASPNPCGAEIAWTSVLTGCHPGKTGHWSRFRFDAATYAVRDVGAYDFRGYPPFYALGDRYRVGVFDVPQAALADRVHGVQVLAWGARSARARGASRPADLLAELTRRHGRHPALERDHASFWNPIAVTWLRRALLKGIARRAAICRDLLRRERWDLFLTAFGESHSAGHYFWHLSQDHPLQKIRAGTADPLHDVYHAIDRSIGEILTTVPRESIVLVFSQEGMSANTSDLPSMVFLPEVLYRLDFPGRQALTGGHAGGPIPSPIVFPWSHSWVRAVWSLGHHANPVRQLLLRWAPIELTHWLDRLSGRTDGLAHPASAGALFYLPPLWYRPHWPRMRAFALPSFSDGCVRVNVQGREVAGIVPPEGYDAVCAETAHHLRQLTNPRTGHPLVREVRRVRSAAYDGDPKHPDADLVVLWADEPTDVADSPSVGRIGPVLYGRTGGHGPEGFIILAGPDIAAGSRLPRGTVMDLAPTILTLLDAQLPEHFDGTPLPVASAKRRP